MSVYCFVAGALLVKNSSANVLRKTYFGGGTVQVALAAEAYHVNRKNISERYMKVDTFTPLVNK